MLTAALFPITKTLNQPVCLSIDEQIKKYGIDINGIPFSLERGHFIWRSIV